LVKRKVAIIDKELCNGCGLCVTPCAEGAIEIVNGKARIFREELCDGAGFCLSICPTGALKVIEKEAPKFNESEAEEKKERKKKSISEISCFLCEAGEDEKPLFPVRYRRESLWLVHAVCRS
jgi:MinD superfamily P-loop ATPase